MKKEILVLGKGFIGSRLQESLGCNISDRKLYSLNNAYEEIDRFNPKIIINCIGYTGERNVDDCESQQDKTLQANTFLPIILAEAALRKNIKLIHIGSGCIYHFDYKKQKPITEKELPDFFELFYSRTKIYSDKALEILSEKFNILVLRIRIPLDNRPNPRNILTKLLNYKKIIDIPNSITYVPDLIEALRHLMKIDARGIYNAVNKGALRYPELMEVYKKYVPNFQYETIKPSELNLVRTNLILSTKKLEKAGFKIRDIHEVLEECVKNYISY
ncbi:MAG: sugar nucleotide-binding protein [Candidatus Ratteibacteria bacterium]|nr:sugar nucleotide-binding protein [Candidatus Ratteibacteria bacterium]